MIEVYGFGNPKNFNKNLSLRLKNKNFTELETNLLNKLDNLPTFEPDSLSLLYYLQLLDVDFIWHSVSHPSSSPTGELPVLKSGLLFISGVDKIMQWLKTEGYDSDKNLNTNEKLYNLSYSKLFGDYLKDSFQYYIYQDDNNFINWTRPLMGKLLSVPFNYITPGYLIEKSKTRLNTYYSIHKAEHTTNSTAQKVSLALKYYRNTKKTDSTLTVEFKILNQIQTIYNQIEAKLGDKPYLFGDNVSSSDLIVASYLLCHANPIWNNATLYNQLSKNHPKLIDYAIRVNETVGQITHINSNTHSAPWYDFTAVKNFVTSNILPKNSPVTYKKMDWESLAYVGLGIGSLVTYAIYHGLIQFVRDDSEVAELEVEAEKSDEKVGYLKEMEGPPKLPILRDDSEDESSDDDDDD